MALNPPMTFNGEPCRVEGEYFVMKRGGVEFEFSVTGGSKYTGKGYMILTTCRIVAINNKNPNSPFKAFDIPLGLMKNEELKQPIFGSNYITGTCKPLFNILPGDIKFKIWFMEGGIGTFVPAFFNMVSSLRKNNNKGHDNKLMNNIIAGQFAKTAYIDPNDPSVIFLEQPDIPNSNNNGVGNNFNTGSNNINNNFNNNVGMGVIQNQIPNQNINQIPNQNINQIPNQNFNQIPNQNINQIPNQNFNQIPNQNIHNYNQSNKTYSNNFTNLNQNYNQNNQDTQNNIGSINNIDNLNSDTQNSNTTNQNININQFDNSDLNNPYPSLNDINGGDHINQNNYQNSNQNNYPNNNLQNLNNVNLSNNPSENNPKYFGVWGPELKKNN